MLAGLFLEVATFAESRRLRGFVAMAKVVRYKRPRKINVVSVSLAAVLAVAAWFGYQYIPLYLLEQEAYRVLEETGSHVAGRIAYFRVNSKASEHLRERMHNDLRLVGVDDPDSEVWLEIDEEEVRLGVIYSEWVEWPMDVFPRSEKVYQVEHIARVQ